MMFEPWCEIDSLEASNGNQILNTTYAMLKPPIIRVSGLILMVGGLWLANTQIAPSPAKLETLKVADDIYVIHNDVVPGNTTVLITDEGLILFDDKFDVDHQGIITELKKLTSQPIKYVVNTHHHPDHTGGNAKMQAIGAQVIASTQARAHMVEGNLPGAPNLAFDGHASLFLGGKETEMYYLGRGHTNGDIVIQLPRQKVLITGDLYTVGDPKITSLLIDYNGGGSIKEWSSTLDAALKLNFETVIPGHGPIMDRKGLIEFRDGVIKLRNRVHELCFEKKTRAEIANVMKEEFHWSDIQMAAGLDGIIAEMK